MTTFLSSLETQHPVKRQKMFPLDSRAAALECAPFNESVSACTGRRIVTFMSPYRLHLFGDGGYLLDFGPQLVSLLVHHLLQLQHHLSLLPLDTVCEHEHTHTHKGFDSGIEKLVLYCYII